MAKIYLDTSALAKRYVKEEGTEILDLAFEKASSERQLVFSFWNIGESLGVYDQYLKRKEITENQLKNIIQRMFKEFGQLVQKRTMVILPLSAQVIAGSWPYILDHHMYEADAIQIVGFRLAGCDFMLSADKKFIAVCKQLGIECYNVELKEDQDRVREQLGS
jgi:predicted nucleic acid-binding protein